MAEDVILNVNIRKEILKVPVYRKAKKAIAAIKKFVKKNTRLDNISIGKYLNMEITKNGMKNPPVKYTLRLEKSEDKVNVELASAPKEEKKEKEKKGLRERLLRGKKEPKKNLKDTLIEKQGKTPEDELEEEKKEVLKEKSSEKTIKKESKAKPEVKEAKKTDKEEAVMIGQEKIVAKTEKPKNVKKK